MNFQRIAGFQRTGSSGKGKGVITGFAEENGSIGGMRIIEGNSAVVAAPCQNGIVITAFTG